MTSESPAGLASIDAVTTTLASAGYIATREISTAIYLAHHLRKPVLIEGPAGVGKTELAVSAAKALGFALLRLQCYEGLDDSRALYEWKYGKQLLYTQILKEKIGHVVSQADNLEQSFAKLAGFQDLFFSRDFLQPRPLLQAMEQSAGSVLLIDEIDKSEEAFEALLLEVLADYQVTIPEIGTIRAQVPPLVVLTTPVSWATRSSAAACTCTSTFPTPRSSSGCCAPGFPRSPNSCWHSWWPSSSCCGRRTSASRRRSPNRSTGRARCCCCMPASSTKRWSATP